MPALGNKGLLAPLFHLEEDVVPFLLSEAALVCPAALPH